MVTRTGTVVCGDSGGRTAAKRRVNAGAGELLNQFSDVCIQEEIRSKFGKEN